MTITSNVQGMVGGTTRSRNTSISGFMTMVNDALGNNHFCKLSYYRSIISEGFFFVSVQPLQQR